MNDRTALNCTLFFLAGGVTGASVALLLAPQSGQATRDLLRRKAGDTAASARDIKDNLVRRGGQLRDDARDIKDNLVRRGEQLRDDARERVDGVVAALSGNGGELPV